jgi:hypothetical protein
VVLLFATQPGCSATEIALAACSGILLIGDGKPQVCRQLEKQTQKLANFS